MNDRNEPDEKKSPNVQPTNPAGGPGHKPGQQPAEGHHYEVLGQDGKQPGIGRVDQGERKIDR